MGQLTTSSAPLYAATPRSASREGAERAWGAGHALVAATLLLTGVYATWSGWVFIVHSAIHDEESSQILVVPVVLVWLLWVRRHRLRDLAPSFSLLGPLFILGGWTVWEFAYRRAWVSGEPIASVAIAVGCVLAVVGARPFWRLLPVFGVLLFAIPVQYQIRMLISVPLQGLTARITEHLLQIFGAPVTRSGSVLTLNGVDVGVVEACNGMRMVFALFLIGYLFAFMERRHWGTRLIILALCPLLALVCNVLRLVPTIFVYGYGSDAAAEAFHDVSGWVMIGVAFGMMMGVVAAIRWTLAEDVVDETQATAMRTERVAV